MNNECLICFEDCDENVSCCKKYIHLKCLNTFWQYNPNNFNKCPHCNNNPNHIIINIQNNQINNNNIQRINDNNERVDKKCLIFSCSSLFFLLFLISLLSYIK
jgi:hypothetical protein